MNKNILLIISIVVLSGFIIYTRIDKSILANEGYGPMDKTLIQKLVDRFGLKEEEVQSVFDEVRNERHQEMQSRVEEQLSEAVQNKEITEEQKQLILQKKQELQELRDTEELNQWAEENSIDLKYLGIGMFGRNGNGMHQHMQDMHEIDD